MANSREKGKRGELEWRDVLREHGFEAERGGHAQGDGAKGMFQDVEHNVPDFWFEVKRVEAFSCLTRAMTQAKRDAAAAGRKFRGVPSRANGQDWMVSLPVEDFFTLLGGYLASEEIFK